MFLADSSERLQKNSSSGGNKPQPFYRVIMMINVHKNNLFCLMYSGLVQFCIDIISILFFFNSFLCVFAEVNLPVFL